MKGLTDRQREVLLCIWNNIQEQGYPPTIRDIGEALGIRSTNGVNDHLKALERKGFIEREASKSRALQITDHGERWLRKELDVPPPTSVISIPLVGDIAAGTPIEAIETGDDVLHIDPSLLGRGVASDSDRVIALRVSGESMIDAGIYDGDIVFVRRQSTASRGEIVAAIVEGEGTVKRYYPEQGRIRLQPENEAMEPIYVDAAQAREGVVLGKVIAVYRRM